ncbi:MAG TPA: ATP-binding protein [Candidatus Dormibacteraeota bacterium]|nr:ATP-binding protein [Candidatus Dormibacteraeota bacterium]
MPKPGVAGKRHVGSVGRRPTGPDAPGARRPALAQADHAIREHLARELHDRVAQTLAGMLIDLEQFKADQTGRAGVLRQIDLLQEWTRDALANVRDVVYDLRGEAISGTEFPKILRTALLEPFARRTGIGVRMLVTDAWPVQLPAATATDLYRIVQEALQNAYRHSGARQIEITLGLNTVAQLIEVTVTDDGRGLPAFGELRPGHGLVGMRERAVLMGGELETVAVSSGGTSIRVVIPVR